MARSRLMVVLIIIAAIVIAFIGCRPPKDIHAPDDETGEVQPQSQVIQLYFIASNEDLTLQPVERTIEPDDAVYQRVFELLIAGPTADERARELSPVLPGGTRVLSAVLSGDTLIVDLSRELITTVDFPMSATTESLALESIALTFGQFPGVRSVRLLVEGRQEGTVDDREIADFWGHVGLPPTIRTRQPSQPDAAQTAGTAADGLKLTGVRWSWCYEEGRLRVVFDVAELDGSEATAIPFTRAERSADGGSILVFLNGMRGIDAPAPRPGQPLAISSPVATELEWITGEEFADDQMLPFMLQLVTDRVSGFQLFGLTEPVRIVLDVFGE